MSSRRCLVCQKPVEDVGFETCRACRYGETPQAIRRKRKRKGQPQKAHRNGWPLLGLFSEQGSYQ